MKKGALKLKNKAANKLRAWRKQILGDREDGSVLQEQIDAQEKILDPAFKKLVDAQAETADKMKTGDWVDLVDLSPKAQSIVQDAAMVERYLHYTEGTLYGMRQDTSYPGREDGIELSDIMRTASQQPDPAGFLHNLVDSEHALSLIHI